MKEIARAEINDPAGSPYLGMSRGFTSNDPLAGTWGQRRDISARVINGRARGTHAPEVPNHFTKDDCVDERECERRKEYKAS